MSEIETKYNIDIKASSDNKEKFVKWTFAKDYQGNMFIKMKFEHIISKLVWHSKGDYFSTMAHNI